MKILLASPDTAVSRIVSDLMKENGHEVEIIGGQDVRRISSRYGDADLLILNSTTSINRRIIEDLDERSKIIDMSLSKTPMARYRGQFISISVLVSQPGEESQSGGRFVLIDDLSPDNAGETLEKLFGKAQFEIKGAQENDKMVSEVLVKPYIMALLSRKVSDLDYECPTNEYGMIQDLARIVTNYNIDTIRDLLRNNPHTGEIVASIEENVKRVWNELSNY